MPGLRPEHTCSEYFARVFRMSKGFASDDQANQECGCYGNLRSHIEFGVSTADSSAKAICQLLERAQIRSFKDKVLFRISKWIFIITSKVSGKKELRPIKEL